MRLSSIELSWFRGAAENATLDTGGRSLAVYGPNGSGKSSFADALELVVAERIAHLAHEHGGLTAACNTHAPANQPARVTLRFRGQETHGVELDQKGGLKILPGTAAAAERVGSWKRETIILRQDEVAHFIHATKGQKYSALLPLIGLSELEELAKNLGALAKAVDREARPKNVADQADRLELEIKNALGTAEREAAEAAVQQLVNKFLPTAAQLPGIAAAKELAEHLSGRLERHDREVCLSREVRELYDAQLPDRLGELSEAEEKAALAVDRLLERRLSVLEATGDFLEEPGEDAIQCPACGTPISKRGLAEHVRRELANLGAARTARDNLEVARRAAQMAAAKWLDGDGEEPPGIWLAIEGAKATLDRLVAAVSCSPAILVESPRLRQDTLPMVEELHRLLNQTRRESPPEIPEILAAQAALKAFLKFPDLQRLRRKHADIKALLRSIRDAEGCLRTLIKRQTEVVLGKISTEIQRLWAKLHPDEPIDGVRLCVPNDADKAIDVGLKFFGMSQLSPRVSLSEGHRNSLGLCIFLALVRLRGEPDAPVVLDDIVSSLDREHRARIVDVLREDFADRQVLLLTHSRDWYDELRRRLEGRGWQFRELEPWDTPAVGLRWTSRNPADLGEAREALALSPEIGANRARAFLDVNLAIAADQLQLSMPYMRGDSNNRRGCPEFLSRFRKDGKKRFRRRLENGEERHQAALDLWDEASRLVLAWGNPASHGAQLVRHETERLIDACEMAWRAFYCDGCGEPVWASLHRLGNKRNRSCGCGQLIWK